MPSGVYIRTNEMKNNMSIAHKGYEPSNESKKKQSEIMKIKYKLGELTEGVFKEGQIAWNKGKKHSDESKKKMSNSAKGRVAWNKGISCSEETKKKISLSKTNPSEETKKKMSEVTIKRHQNNKGNYKDTKPELECERILKNNNINYTKQFRITNRLYDFYLSDYNLLIEVDGTFYHGKGIKDEDLKYDMQKKSRRIDKLKDVLALEKGYNLIRVWEDEINQFEEYCKTMLFYNNYKQIA